MPHRVVEGAPYRPGSPGPERVLFSVGWLRRDFLLLFGGGKRDKGVGGFFSYSPPMTAAACAGSLTCQAIAQMNPASSRATAVHTCCLGLP